MNKSISHCTKCKKPLDTLQDYYKDETVFKTYICKPCDLYWDLKYDLVIKSVKETTFEEVYGYE